MNNERSHGSSARGRKYQPRGARGRSGRRGRNRGQPHSEQTSRSGSQRQAPVIDKSSSIDLEFVQQLRDRNRNRFTIEATAESSSFGGGSTGSSPPYGGNTALSDDRKAPERVLHDKNSLSFGKNASVEAVRSRSTTPLDSIVNNNFDTVEPKIGVGRATGVSRVPDSELSESSKQVQHSLECLERRVECLLRKEQTVVQVNESNVHTADSAKNFAEWEAIHGAFRRLTMSITASTKPEVKQLAISVYESAADASLYGGNLSFFLSCQTRLLKELYAELPGEQRKASRYSEFIGYSLLYFGVFHVDDTEIAQLLRSMDHYTTKDSSVRLSFSIISAIRNRDGMKIFALYKRCSVQQRVLIFPALESIRRKLLSVLIRAYLQLSKTKTASLLGIENETETLAFLATERPDLAAQVSSENEEYSFRISL